ncbi:hypothetical protein FRC03_001808 [Tulasnella sp. 419]|nr:hypothetical protein FRC03_001808 [Tulasnella sp. 419]
MDSKGTLWDTGRDEEVQVNQRALIDKVLARYSGEFTVFRELLQNSDDAAAKTVEIHFNTRAYLDRIESGNRPPEPAGPSSSPSKLPNLKTQPLVQWVFRNDGIPFRDEDWNRLKKIAEGNPDEQKIGAFGVGFYSLFSVTDEPFVKSGKQWMGFYWKDNKDQLYARRGDLPSPPGFAPSGGPWTSFDMPLREASPLPGLPVDIARFLATSLTFMTNLRDVSMFVDDHRLAHIQKDVGIPKPLTMPRNLTAKSPQGTMEVKTVHSSDLHITAEVMRWVYQTGTEKKAVAPKPATSSGGFFSSLLASFATPTPARTPEPQAPTKEPDPLEVLESSVLLTVYSARVDVRLDKKMSNELERATKKKPPTTCTYSLIYTGKDEYDASKREDERDFKATGSIFQGLRADLDASGTARVFIGHATSQSTGIGGHVSARFIPTVERESIDLVDRNVSQWNKELLYVGGFLARSVYEMQIADVRDAWNQAAKAIGPNDTMDETVMEWLENKSIHTLRFFSFYPTTPSSVVGSQMEAAFFACAQDRSIPVISTEGVRSAREVRYYDPTFRSFMKKLPMLSKNVAEGALAMVTVLRDRGMLQNVSFKDVLAELSQRALSEEEMVECLKWRINLDIGEIRERDKEVVRKQFLDSAVFSIPKDERFKEERIITLASIETFVSPTNVIPPNLPLPLHTLPFSVSKNFKPDSLRSFFGWRDLGVVEWVEYLVAPSSLKSLQADENMTVSPMFSEKVLNIVAKMWTNLSKQQQTQMVTLLKDRTVIPTRSGLKTPGESYFSNANVFQDLPIVTFPKGTLIKGNLEKLLTSLGVMRHVDLQIVFNRMINSGDWGVQDLMKYLVAVKGSLTPTEIGKLRQTAAFPQERGPTADLSQPQKRTIPSELYEPSDVFRELGLPVLDWGTQKWKMHSEEAKMLFEFGLKRYPDLPTIIGLMARQEETIRRTALKYFLEQFDTRYAALYSPTDFTHLAYIPAVKPDGTHFLAKPKEVFRDSECAVMGFSLVEQEFRNDALTKLRIENHPPIRSIMNILLNSPPEAPEVAQKYFEYLTNRLADFSSTDYDTLRQALIVPAMPPENSALEKRPRIIMARPGECFFKSDRETSTSKIHAKLFTFVDFGSRANIFLRACGVKDQPSVQEVVTLLVKDPKRFLDLAGSPTGYLEQLRNIAAYGNYPSSLLSQMRTSPFLLGYRRTLRSGEKTTPSAEESDEREDYDLTFDLLKPAQVVIVDDTNAYSLFSDSLYAAPEEDILETFYQNLGSPRLTSLIKEEYQPQNVENSESRIATETRNLIIQRFPLLLHERNTHAKVRMEWLSQGENFTVRGCQRLKLSRTLTFQGKSNSKAQEVSATAVMVSRLGITRLVLLLSKNDRLDMYEVANSMCKILLKNPRPQDSLLFMTILSTDLRALGRRGYPVDRILHQQRLEKELREAKRAEEENRQRQEHLEQQRQYEQQQQQKMPPGADPFQPKPPVVQAAMQSEPSKPEVPRPSSSSTNATLVDHNTAPSPAPQRPSSPPLAPTPLDPGSRPRSGVLNSIRNQIQKNSPRLIGRSPTPKIHSSPRNPDAAVTPSSNIEHNIQMAINACRPESGSVLENRQRMTMVKESLEDGYCDVSGSDKDFDAMGMISGYRFFIAHDVPNPHEILQQKQAAIQRFASSIIDPLKALFKLTPTSLHIFYDQKGDLIAFNRNGGLFLNLRFYEGWHDIDQ